MSKMVSKFALTAGILLALAFTFSCSDGSEGGDNGGNTPGGGGSNLSDLPKQVYFVEWEEYTTISEKKEYTGDANLSMLFEMNHGYDTIPAGKIQGGQLQLRPFDYTKWRHNFVEKFENMSVEEVSKLAMQDCKYVRP